MIVDLVSKGNRIRTVPIPSWAKQAIDDWIQLAGINQDHAFRPIYLNGFIDGDSMTAW